MNSKYFLILIVFLVMLIAVLFGSNVQAQKVLIDKKVEVTNQANQADSTIVTVKTIKTGNSVNNKKELDIDYLVQVLNSGKDSNSEPMVKIISIHNGDTVIKEFNTDSFDPNMFHEFEPEFMDEELLQSLEQFEFPSDSMLQWSTKFDSLFDPLKFKTFEMEWTGKMNEMDSIMEHHFKLNEFENGNQMIFIGDDGEEIKIERNGEMVILNKNNDLENIDNDVNKNERRKKVMVRHTRIQLDELTESEKSDLKSKGIKTRAKEPEFDYLKFYPNPSEGSINIEFRADKPLNTEVRITNMIGKILYEEKLNNFSGAYNKSINLSENGTGTYLLQIIQGKKVITRKIMVD